MAPSPNPSLAMKSPLPSGAAFSPAPLASAYSSKSSTPMSPASPMSSHDSPKPSTATSTSSAATSTTSNTSNVASKPQLAIKPVAPTPAAVRPLQMQIAANSPGGNVMSMTSVVSSAPQSPAAAQSPAATVMPGKPPMSITSKEWVIPPRPKPGRKPATDTPPTKRKAQNRAAQRAFRERRAARVGELEDLLEDQKNEHDRVERESQDKIHTLETEVQVLRSRCQMLENLLEKEKATNQAWATKERQASQSSARSNSMHRTNSIQPQQTQHQPHQHQQSLGHIHSPAPHKLLQNDQQRGSTSSSISSASGRRISAQPFSISQIISPPDDDEQLTCGNCNLNGTCACADDVMAATVSMDCGKCTLGTKCACLEASINALTGGGFSAAPSELKRSHSTSSPSPLAPEEKRARHFNDVDTTTEIDFTHMFARPKPSTSTTSLRTPLPSMQPRHQSQPQQPSIQQQQQPAPHFEIPLKERCGFCSDGTYCVCADSMPGVTMTGSLAISAGTVVAQQKTPPPSEADLAPMPLEVTATGAIKLSSMAALRRQKQQLQQQQQQQETKLAAPTSAAPASSGAPRSKCGPGGPGTCAQCLADPVSGLFCRSLAANFERQGGSSGSGGGGGCCGGGGAGGGCCKDKKSNNTLPPITSSSTFLGPNGSSLTADAAKKSISLSCADAYKTLSSHRHFEEATDEISTWLPKLRAAPRHDPDAPARRHPMEVEAASIMSVLKGFDVRFGKDV